jgi:hypothetical protein
MTASAIVDIKHTFIGGEGKPVRCQEIADQQRHGAEIGADAVHARITQVPLFGDNVATRVGEIDAAVRLDDDVIRPIEAVLSIGAQF